MDISKIEINQIKARLSASKVRILSLFPFYGVLIMETKFFLDEKEKSFSTNGREIYFNPNYLSSLKDDELDISILHEIFHIILKHPFRYKKNMNNDLYHLAADIVVNSNIMFSNKQTTPLYIKGKALPYLAPNDKEGYHFSTEEVYAMLLKKYPDKVIPNSQTDEENDDSDSSDSESADTFEKAVGPKLIHPAFKYVSDRSGKIYLRSSSYKNNDGEFNWNMKDNYSCPKTQINALYFINDKVRDKFPINHIDIKTVGKLTYCSTPTYTKNFDETYYDVESIINNKKCSCDYYYFVTNQELIDFLNETQFSDKSLIKDEINYSKFVHKKYLDISPLHLGFFKKFANQRGISGNAKSIIIPCRNAIADSAKYDLNYGTNPTPKDDVLYFLTESKKGICFHFATALVLLYRSLGLPARFVAGYLVEATKNKECIGFEESGHAWVEVYLNGSGWIRIDPTPISASGGSYFTSGNLGDSNSKNNHTIDSHDRWQENADDDKEMSEEEINSRIIKAYDIQEMGAKGCGSLPGFIETLVKSLREPELDWRTVLNQFIQEDVCDFSFLEPDNRMQDSEFILPSFSEKDEEVKNVLFMVDCSGSMSNKQIGDCFSEIQGALTQFNGKLKGYIGFFDSICYGIHEIDGDTEIAKIKPVGRGGTNFNAVFRFVRNKMTDNLPSTIIILTDGDAPIPEEKAALGIPTMWVINNKIRTPHWGRVLRIS